MRAQIRADTALAGAAPKLLSLTHALAVVVVPTLRFDPTVEPAELRQITNNSA
jgi:hypothetical protein